MEVKLEYFVNRYTNIYYMVIYSTSSVKNTTKLSY